MTEKLKVLNLYAGIGGNRKLWDEVADINVTAVEYNEDIAAYYQELYPNDKVIVTDAHDYLLDNFQDYDFIWTSPPCQTHSKLNYLHQTPSNKNYKPKYVDMKLWKEILFLKGYTRSRKNIRFVVENTDLWYRKLVQKPILPDLMINRHAIWSNFYIPPMDDDRIDAKDYTKATYDELLEYHDLEWDAIEVGRKVDPKHPRQVVRNCVHYPVGKHIFQAAITSMLHTTENSTKSTSLEAFL